MEGGACGWRKRLPNWERCPLPGGGAGDEHRPLSLSEPERVSLLPPSPPSLPAHPGPSFLSQRSPVSLHHGHWKMDLLRHIPEPNSRPRRRRRTTTRHLIRRRETVWS